MRKRQREDQHELAVTPPPETRHPTTQDSFSSIVLSDPNPFPFIPASFYRPPLSWPFLAAYNDICRCEFRLNTCTTAAEAHDVLLDSWIIYHRVHDEVDMFSDLNNRILDVEYNAHFKILRFCSQIIRVAAQLVDDIVSCQDTHATLLPSQEIFGDTLRRADEIVMYCHPTITHLYETNIRPVLVRYWLEDSSTTTDSFTSLSQSSDSVASHESSERVPTPI